MGAHNTTTRVALVSIGSQKQYMNSVTLPRHCSDRERPNSVLLMILQVIYLINKSTERGPGNNYAPTSE